MRLLSLIQVHHFAALHLHQQRGWQVRAGFGVTLLIALLIAVPCAAQNGNGGNYAGANQNNRLQVNQQSRGSSESTIPFNPGGAYQASTDGYSANESQLGRERDAGGGQVDESNSNAAAGSEAADPESIQLLPPQGERKRSSKGSALGSKPPWMTTFGSLAVVLGAFFVLAWFIRRTRPKGLGALPLEAVELLGRSPLDGKQHLQVVRFGNKLLLVAVSAGSAQTLCELSDADEINHVMQLCQKSQPGSVSESFRQIFNQMGREKTRQGFLEEEAEEQRAPRNTTRGSRSRALFEA